MLNSYLRASAQAMMKRPRGFFSAWLRYWRSYRQFKRMQPSGSGFLLTPSAPRITDDLGGSGRFGRYVYQDSWAFKHVLGARPSSLVDIASSTYYVAFAAQVTTVTSVDIRPLASAMDSIEVRQGDITALPFEDGSQEAISSLSVIEHVGLGRYGDQLQWDGMRQAVAELRRVLRRGGMLLVAFPVGAENVVHFNAHRVLTPENVDELFDGLHLVDERYALADRLVDRAEFEALNRPYSYGCYRLTK